MFVCPYCLNDVNTDAIKYSCPDCGSDVTDIGFVEKKIGKIKCKQKGCGRIATIRKCPKCDAVLPAVMLATPNLMFSIVGVSGSGKTNYITVMLKELGNAGMMKLALAAQNKETRDWQNFNVDLMYNQHLKAEATPGGTQTPQIWQIKNLNKRAGDNVPTYTFDVFDGAGEDHENIDSSATVCRYIEKSEAIVFTVDPLILTGVRNIVGENAYVNSMSGDAGFKNSADIVNSMANYIKTCDLKIKNVNKLINKPIAIVFTKIDTVINKEFTNSILSKKSPHTGLGYFDKSDCNTVHRDIEEWITRIDFSFITAVKSNFKNYKFFGVSSFGEPPKDQETLAQIHPHRVLDPILWLFANHKPAFIDSK